MKHLFIIFSKRDLRKALNVSESSKNTAYFLWHADIGVSDMELLRSRGSVYQESDFVSTKERYVVEKECYQFLKSLDDQAKKSLAYKTISIPQIVWRDTRLFVNTYLFLRRIVPQLIDVFRPECIHIPKARKFDNRLIRSICEEHSQACLSDYGNRAYMMFTKETGSIIHWASDAANIIK